MKKTKVEREKLKLALKKLRSLDDGETSVSLPPAAVEVFDASTKEVLGQRYVFTTDEAVAVLKALKKKCEKEFEEKYRASGRDPEHADVKTRLVVLKY